LRDRLHQRSQPGAHFEQSHQVVFANIQKGQLIGAGAKAAGNDTGLAIESIRGLRRPVLRLRLGTRFPSRARAPAGDADSPLGSSHHPVFDASEQIAYRLDLAVCNQLSGRLFPEVLMVCPTREPGP
jgi:hypothetical protein